jgi:hypothetical protein
MLQQSATLFGLGMLGVSQFAALNPFQNLGGGGFGQIGGQFGNLGGGLNMLGGIQGGLGGGFNQMGQQGGFRGNFQGNANLGVGGGVVGFGGQQLGQFGNLGGQFGLQGGNQSQILITVIRQVVGKPKDWAIQFDPVDGTPLDPTAEAGQDQSLVGENNQLGFYPPAMALVVKASSTIHTRPSNLVITGGGGGGPGPMGALPREGGDRVAVGNRQKNDQHLAALPEEKPKGPPPDPRKVWKEALSRGATEPGLIIATADFLAANKQFLHAAEFLKADLRLGIVVEAWVYQALAVALKQSNGKLEEIERAEVSSADLAPMDSQGYLNAARSLAENKRYGRALAFCRQAATLEPTLPYAYADALDYAELARDARAMEWAAGHLLQQDWPYNNQALQDKARRKLEALASGLEQAGRKNESDRLMEAMDAKGQRDVVIKLSWQGQADLDLQVLEPSGSICSPLHRQTVGGGILIGDSLADMTSETYLAAQAFTGQYRITVEKMWGKPLGDRAQLRIIRHQGTAEQTEEVVTVPLQSRYSQPILVDLDKGRRKHTAYVPPPSLQKPPEPSATPVAQGTDLILHKLRLMADPEITSFTQVRGAAAGPGQATGPASGSRLSNSNVPEQTIYQTPVTRLVPNSLDVTAQAVLSSDRRHVRLSMSPVFTTGVGVQLTGAAVIVNPLIPGGRIGP